MKLSLSRLIHHLPTLRSFSTFDPTKLLTAKRPLCVDKIISILEKSDPIEPALDRVAHILRPELVSTVFDHRPTPQSGFRFLIWAMKRRHLETWKLHDAIAELLTTQDDGLQLWWDAIEVVHGCGVGVPSDAFLVLILGYCKAGEVEKAVDVFGKMRDFDCEPDVFVYNAILHVVVQKGLVLLAMSVYNQMLMLNCGPNVVTYSILLQGLCKCGEIADALKLFDEMTERGIAPNNITYTIVLLGLCRGKRRDDVEKLLSDMERNGCYPDEITFNAVLSGFFKVGKVDEGFMLLKSFSDRGYVLGINGYSCIIDGLFKAGRSEEAVEWFRKLREEENVSPDVVLYTTMIKGFCDEGRLMDAVKLMQEMTERGVVPDTQCYNVLIKGFCDMGLLDDAQSLKLEISRSDCFPNTCTYTILICGMCRKGLVAEAKQIFQEMEKLGCLPSVVTFNALINGLCKAGEFEEARLLFYNMEIGRNPSLFLRLSQATDPVMDTNSLRNLVERLCESGSYLKAYKLLTNLADNGVAPDTVTYNTLINSMCKSGDTSAALKLMQRLKLKGLSPDSFTYGTIIDGLYRAGKEEEAVAKFEEMLDVGCLPSPAVYKCLMTWLCRKGKVSVSFTLWLKYLRNLKNRDEEAIKFIEERFERGEFKEAIRGLLEIDFKLKEFDLAPYTIWLIGLCQTLRLEEAMDIFHVLQEFNITVTPPSCVKLIQGFCSQGKLDQAVDLFLYTLESGFTLKRGACNELILSLLSQNYVKLVFNLLGDMEEAGYDLDALLFERTKSLLQYQLNVHASTMSGGGQDAVDYQMASPG